MAAGAQDSEPRAGVPMTPLRAKKHSIPLICMTWKERLTAAAWVEFYRDDFDDDYIGLEWTTFGIGAGRSIVESGEVCTISIDAGTDGEWRCLVSNNAPRMYFQLNASLPCRIEAKMNSHTVPTGYTHAGIMVAKEPDGQAANPAADQPAYIWGRFRSTVAGFNGVRVVPECGLKNGIEGAPWDGTGPYWLRVEISAAKVLSFFSSADGITWVDLGWTQAYNFTPLYVGLCVMNQTSGGFPWPGRAAPFEYFLIEEYGEIGDFTTNEECISFEDVRSPARVYAGRLKTLSPMKRSFADKTGLYQISDMSMVLANADRYYSDRAASGILKNQEVEIYHAWTEDPEVNRVLLMRMFIEDYSLEGNEFHIKMKDVTQKYFSKKIPANICTVADFPDIHPDHVGRYMPEVLGECVVGAGYDRPGAVEAVFIDTTGPPYVHLASRGELNDVTAVYRADGTLINPINWTFIAGPPSTISINHADGNGTVYFDAEGYFLPAWDSTNGYIQNLVYIIEYLLFTLMEMPTSLLDPASFDDLADYFDDQGWGTNGFLIIQKRQDAMEVLRQLLFTGGIKGYVAKGGKFTVDIKDINDYEITSTDSHLFTQTDLLRASERRWNLTKAINIVNARFGFIPWQQLWIGADDDFRENFYDADMEEDELIREEPLPV